MTPQSTGLSRSKKMRELGFPQDNNYKWWVGERGETFVGAKSAPGIGKSEDEQGWCSYTVEEMKKWLPEGVQDKRLLEKSNEANNFADVLIELAIEGKIKYAPSV
jgi:hypothetical protein